MNRTLLPALKPLLWWHSRPSLVARALAWESPRLAPKLKPGRLTVGLAQMRMDAVDSAGAYALNIFRLVRDAVERGAQLVAFPEYASLPLLGLIPGSKALESSSADAVGIQESDVFRLISAAARRVYLTTFSLLAKSFRLFIAAGTLIEVGKDGRLYNTAHLFDREGKLIGTQRKLHCAPTEDGWLATGDSLQVFDLPFGKLAMPICMDYTYWEVTRLAALRGVDILVDSSAGADGDREWRAARGARMRVQEVPCYGLHVYGLANQFGQRWRGPSRIVAPAPLLPPNERALAMAGSPDREAVVVHELDLDALRAYRDAQPPDYHVALYRKYLPALYQSATQSREAAE